MIRYILILLFLGFIACTRPGHKIAPTLQLVVEIKELNRIENLQYYNNKPFTGMAVSYQNNKKYFSKNDEPVLYFQQQLKDGLLINQIQYYDTGARYVEFNFNSKSQYHGPYYLWYRTSSSDHKKSKLHVTGTYVNGKKHGKWTTFHENGQKSKEGNYTMGVVPGEWQYWYKNGEVNNEGSIKKLTPNQKKKLKRFAWLLYFFK